MGSPARPGDGLKWTFYEADVLPAWVAEMDFGLAPPVASALHDAVDRADTAYHYPDLERRVAMAAVDFWSRRLGWAVDPDRVFSVPDVVEGVRRAIVHLTRPGTPVVLHTPVYAPFFGMVEQAGRQVIEAEARRAGDGVYRLDLAAVARALRDGAGSVVLCNPWNPTGRSFTVEEIGELLELVIRHDARMISDEVHAPLQYDSGHQVAANLSSQVITVTSASKAWNLPGLKAAQVVLAHDRDFQTWTDYFTIDKVGVGTFGLIANEAAYRSGEPWLDDVLLRLGANRDLLGELVSDLLPRAVYQQPEATYLAWLDLRAYGLDDPAGFMLEKGRVALNDGAPFGSGGEGHVRLNFATDPETLVGVVERMASVL